MAHLAELVDRHGVDVLEHLDRDLTVPVCDGLQAQGDIIVVPHSIAAGTATRFLRTPTDQVPHAGLAVVRGENGGNTHLLLADGDVRAYMVDRPANGLDLAVVTVGAGATAYLAHPEHGYTGIAPGTYVIRRQREQADEIRLVAD